MSWKVWDTGVATASQNMDLDTEILAYSTEPTLHFYEWQGDSATFGYFINPFHYLSEKAVKQWNLQLARRPTGGGIIFHLTDFAFSVFVPADHSGFFLNTLENYAYINARIQLAIDKFMGQKEATILLPIESPSEAPVCQHFCMAKPTKYDIMYGVGKIAGGAQRRTKRGYLHQGTISLSMPSEDYLMNICGEQSAILSAMKQNSSFLLGRHASPLELADARQKLKKLLAEFFQ